MSRAFVKEDDAGTPEEKVDLPVSAHPNFVTPAGLQMLRDKVATFEDERASVERQAMTDEEFDLLSIAIARLSPQRRKVLLLRLFYEYSTREIADKLDISLRTVHRDLARARRGRDATGYDPPATKVARCPVARVSQAATSAAEPTDDDLRRIIHDGIPGTAMPPAELSDERLAKIVAYVRMLPVARGDVEHAVIVGPELDADLGSCHGRASLRISRSMTSSVRPTYH